MLLEVPKVAGDLGSLGVIVVAGSDQDVWSLR
jgi:hypothetical protein